MALTALAPVAAMAETADDFVQPAGMDADAPDCGDFNEDGILSATDSLGALNFSVGVGDCPVCVCDVDSSGSTTATDALRILRSGVGLPENLDCPPDGVPLAWTGGGDGINWADPDNWETGVIPTGCEAITIADTGNLEVRFDLASLRSTVHSITSDASFLLDGGTLRVRKTMEIQKNFTLDRGLLMDATITANSGGATGLLFPTSSTATLSGTIVDADIDLSQASSRFTIAGNITFNGVANLSGQFARIFFDGGVAQTLDGTGEFIFGDGSTGFAVKSDSPLTIGENIHIHGVDGSVGSEGVVVNNGTIELDGDGTLEVICSGGSNEGSILADTGELTVDGDDDGCTNNGTILATNGADIRMEGVWLNNADIEIMGGGELELDGTWSNAGTLEATDSIVKLGGEFETPAVGTLLRTNSTVFLTGVMDNTAGLTLDASRGEWIIDETGTVVGGVIDVVTGGSLKGESGEIRFFEGVTLNGPMELLQGSRLLCTDGFTLNGAITMQSASELEFGGTGEQLFDGAAEVILASTTGGPRIDIRTGASLRIADTVYIHGEKGQIGTFGQAFINEGTIEADGAGRIDFSGTGYSNEGTIIASSGMFRWSQEGTNNGVIRLGPGLTMNPTDGFVQGPNGRLIIEIDGPGSNGQLNSISDAVALDGALEIDLLNAYEPSIGESFEVVRFSSLTGDFATIDGADFAPGKMFVETIGANGIDVDVVGVP